MKKIMFNDNYCLTKAVLNGKKTMTRRIVSEGNMRMAQMEVNISGGELTERIKDHTFYCFLDEVAIAQSYENIGLSFIQPPDTQWGCTEQMPGYRNKMFVRADLMPHRIRITDIKVERLQDITDDECLREGIEEDDPFYWVPINHDIPNWEKLLEKTSDMYQGVRDRKPTPHFWDSPRKAFAALINAVTGRDTWEKNPYVFAYSFKLIK